MQNFVIEVMSHPDVIVRQANASAWTIISIIFSFFLAATCVVLARRHEGGNHSLVASLAAVCYVVLAVILGWQLHPNWILGLSIVVPLSFIAWPISDKLASLMDVFFHDDLHLNQE